MARKDLIATVPQRYGTRMLQAGDELTVSGPNARALLALGRAELKPAKVQPEVVERKVEEPEPEVVWTPAPTLVEETQPKKAAPRRRAPAKKK